jgi:plastocyanin domain-containing protein
MYFSFIGVNGLGVTPDILSGGQQVPDVAGHRQKTPNKVETQHPVNFSVTVKSAHE